MMNGAMMKQAMNALDHSFRQFGREINVEEVAEIVQQHAMATAVGAGAAGVIPGAGGAVALGIACTSTVTMYGRLAGVMGVRLNNGLIRALGSAVLADLAASVTASFAAAAAISFIPGFGSMASAVIVGMTNFGFVYLAGLIFIKMVIALGVERMETMSEADAKAAAREIQSGMNMKEAVKEAKAVYHSASKA